ncbi:MAG: response regulator transcription factor [Nitrospiraceae bacterium]|nr:response regulator transcription factor [Nitrospiraceae bacterium]
MTRTHHQHAHPLRILLADDHAIVRQGLKQLLEQELVSVQFSEVETGQGLMQAGQNHPWDLAIIDINLPDKNGLDALKEIKILRPELPVLILTLYPEAQYATRALRAGAAGYLTKSTAPAEITLAVDKVLAGGRYISASLAERLADELTRRATPAPTALHELLSDRELEVLRWIARGKTVTEIADQLSLSFKTVSTYRARLLEKLHLNTTADLIRYALDHHLVE